MSLYKEFLAYLVYLYLESVGVVHGDHCEIRESLGKNGHSSSVVMISRVQAMTRRRWMLEGCLEAPYLLTARVFSIYLPHFQGFGK